MNKTLDILREMLNEGMIDKSEYEAERNHYFYLVTAVQEFNERIIEKKIHLESMKSTEKVVDDEKMKSLIHLLENDIITLEEFRKFSKQ